VNNSSQLVGNHAYVDSRLISIGPCRLAGVTGYVEGTARWAHIYGSWYVKVTNTDDEENIEVTVGERVIQMLPGETFIFVPFAEGSAKIVGGASIGTIEPTGELAFRGEIEIDAEGITYNREPALFCMPVAQGEAFAFALPNPIGLDACWVAFSSTEEDTTLTESEDGSIQGILSV
jgi:hypothetical protein